MFVPGTNEFECAMALAHASCTRSSASVRFAQSPRANRLRLGISETTSRSKARERNGDEVNPVPMASTAAYELY